MLKFFAMISCDLCGRAFERLAIPCNADPFIAHEVISDLERAAEDSGWFYYHEEHRCTNCLIDAHYKQYQEQQKQKT